MRKIGSRLVTAVAIAMAAFVSNASAALVVRHLFNPGDDLLTFDTSTRLLWLDLSATTGLSYNDALSSSYVISMGFRFATPNELLTLYTSAGIAPGSSLDRAPGVELLLDLLGCTAQCGVAPAGQGWLNMSDPINTAYAFFQLNPVQAGPPVLYNGETTLPNTAFVSRELPLNSIYRNPTGGQLTGSFLVRQVPEPPIYTLLLAALSAFGLVAHGRRRVEGVSQSVVGAQFH